MQIALVLCTVGWVNWRECGLLKVSVGCYVGGGDLTVERCTSWNSACCHCHICYLLLWNNQDSFDIPI